MKATIASAFLILAVGAVPAAAQQRVLSDRVAKSMPTAYRAPECGLKSNHFKVSSGASYLKTGVENDVPENQKRALDNGERVLLEAMQQNGQEKNPAAFEFLQKMQLTTDQQSVIAGYIDRDGMAPLDAAQKWVDENPDVVATWL